jgi:hypothetical protein
MPASQRRHGDGRFGKERLGVDHHQHCAAQDRPSVEHAQGFQTKI